VRRWLNGLLLQRLLLHHLYFLVYQRYLIGGDVSSLGSRYTSATKSTTVPDIADSKLDAMRKTPSVGFPLKDTSDIQLPGATPKAPSIQLPAATPKAPSIQLPGLSDSPQIPGAFSPDATPRVPKLELPSITTNIPMVSGSTPSPMRSSPSVGLLERIPTVPSGSPYKDVSKIDKTDWWKGASDTDWSDII
jgi:hypothetical protein